MVIPINIYTSAQMLINLALDRHILPKKHSQVDDFAGPNQAAHASLIIA